ncbi:MAG: MFS transporter [Chloroflexi bacterium]|nr:MFS transporter [Chloroflexota bacterium]
MKRFLTPFAMLCLVGFSARLGYQMARPPVLPRFAEELGAQTWLIGLVVGASTITGVFIKFPAGTLSDILGRRRMLVLGAAFFAFPPFLYLLARDPYTLLGIRFLHGFATAIFGPVASAAVADLFQKERGEKLGWFAASSEVGSAFGPLLGGSALAAFAGPGLSKFHYTYLIVGALGVMTLLLALRIPIGRPSPNAGPPSGGGRQVSRWALFREGMWQVLGNRPILIASSVEAAMFLGVGALVAFLPLYAKNVVGLGDAYLGLLLWVPLVMAMVGKPLSGRISDRVGRKPVILLGLALCTATLPLVPMTRNLLGLLLEGAVFGAGMAAVTPSTTALVADLCKTRNYGAAMGVFGAIWDMGEASGPILAGALITAFGGLQAASAYLAAFTIVAAVLVLAGIVFGLLATVPRAASERA